MHRKTVVTNSIFWLALFVCVSNLEAQSTAIVERKNGLHFEAGDAGDLREKMQKLSQDRDLREQLSRGAFETVQPTIEDEAELLTNLYTELTRYP